MKMHGWGRYPVIDAEVYAPGSLDDLKTMRATTTSVGMYLWLAMVVSEKNCKHPRQLEQMICSY